MILYVQMGQMGRGQSRSQFEQEQDYLSPVKARE